MAKRPRAVTEARKKSDELIRQLAEQQGQSVDPEAAAAQHLEGINGRATEEPGEAQNGLQGEDQERHQEAGQATTPPESYDDPDQPPPDEPASDDYRKRYEKLLEQHERLVHSNTVLRGKYESEVPRMAAEIRELKGQLQQLEQQERQPPAGNTEAPAPAAESETVEKIKEALLDEYPSDVVENLDKMIRSIVQSSVPQKGNASDQQIEQLQGQVTRAMNALREQTLTTLVPDWKEIQAQEGDAWVKFLQHRDPVSGRERNDFLQEAWDNHEIQRAAEIFNLYKRERDASRASNRGSEPPIEPESRGADPAQRRNSPRMFRYSEIQAVEKEARNPQGRFRGKEAELKRLRDAYAQAAAGGRIDYSR